MKHVLLQSFTNPLPYLKCGSFSNNNTCVSDDNEVVKINKTWKYDDDDDDDDGHNSHQGKSQVNAV